MQNNVLSGQQLLSGFPLEIKNDQVFRQSFVKILAVKAEPDLIPFPRPVVNSVMPLIVRLAVLAAKQIPAQLFSVPRYRHDPELPQAVIGERHKADRAGKTLHGG